MTVCHKSSTRGRGPIPGNKVANIWSIFMPRKLFGLFFTHFGRIATARRIPEYYLLPPDNKIPIHHN